MKHTYITKNTCSSKIEFDLDGNIVRNIRFYDGCSGNLKAIQTILDGCTVEQIVEKCGGILCGRRPTSCADQLSIAVKEALEEEKK